MKRPTSPSPSSSPAPALLLLLLLAFLSFLPPPPASRADVEPPLFEATYVVSPFPAFTSFVPASPSAGSVGRDGGSSLASGPSLFTIVEFDRSSGGLVSLYGAVSNIRPYGAASPTGAPAFLQLQVFSILTPASTSTADIAAAFRAGFTSLGGYTVGDGQAIPLPGFLPPSPGPDFAINLLLPGGTGPVWLAVTAYGSDFGGGVAAPDVGDLTSIVAGPPLPVPEPSALALGAIGLAGVVGGAIRARTRRRPGGGPARG